MEPLGAAGVSKAPPGIDGPRWAVEESRSVERGRLLMAARPSAMVTVPVREFTCGEEGRRAGSRLDGRERDMIDGPYFVLTVLGVLGTGLVAGVFCGFSTFVMRGLGMLPLAQGVAAMKAINVAAVTPPFMIVFLGSAVLCAVIAVVTFVLWPDEGTWPCWWAARCISSGPSG